MGFVVAFIFQRRGAVRKRAVFVFASWWYKSIGRGGSMDAFCQCSLGLMLFGNAFCNAFGNAFGNVFGNEF